MVAAWKQKLAERQTEISQKSIDKLVNWLEDYYSTFSEATIKRFLEVYTEMLSTLGEKQKPAPADLYKLDSYWALQKSTRAVLQIAGEDIYSQLNTQLKIMYVDIYEGIAPVGNESPCLVSEEEIDELINRAWGPKPKSTQEQVWLYMTILWDKLFGELMHCTIKNLPLNNLEKRLQDQFKSNKQSLDTLFSDSITHIQGYAAMQRYGDDRASSKEEFSYLGSYIDTYGNEEEKEAYSLLATNFSLKREVTGDEDGDGEVGNQEAVKAAMAIRQKEWSFVVELDFETCDACRDLANITWREYYFGPPPLPVHRNCRCSATPYDRELSLFADAANNVADSGFTSIGEGLGKMVIIAALITLGVMVGDDYSSSGPIDEQGWIDKWADKFEIFIPYDEHNPYLVHIMGPTGWLYLPDYDAPAGL